MKHLTTAIAYDRANARDAELASRITAALRESDFYVYEPRFGVKMWQVAHDMAKRDRLIVIGSKESLSDGHIRSAINKFLQKEHDDGGASYMICITVGDGAMDFGWSQDADINEIVGIFGGRVLLPCADFKKMMKRLLLALET